jgi:hypothetical protein
MEDDFIPPSFAAHLTAAGPEVIYHYTNQSGLIGVLENRELWATKIQYMNDASEFRIAFQMLEKHLTDAIHSDGSDQPMLGNSGMRRAFKLLNGLERIIHVNVCVVCFCRNGDLLSQWRAYSGGYGFSIGFNGRGSRLQSWQVRLR